MKLDENHLRTFAKLHTNKKKITIVKHLSAHIRKDLNTDAKQDVIKMLYI